MPCNCDHMEPNEHELESRRVAQHLCYLLGAASKQIPKEYKKIARSIYGKPLAVHSMTADLCRIIGKMSKGEKDHFIYDGKNKEARRLADWWEAHQEADAMKAKHARHKKKQDNLKLSGLSKLSPAEKKALGL